MTDRQRERLNHLKIKYNGDESVDEAANLLREHMHSVVYKCPRKELVLPETAFAVESEGDCMGGRQWLK